MAAICLVTAIVYTHASVNKSGPGPADHSDTEKQSVSSSPLPRVGIIEAKPGIEQAVVTASGEVRPRYQVTLSAEVSGRVKNVSDSLAPGCRIKAGQRLLSLDDTDYKKNLAQAEKNLAEVNLALLQEQRKAEQAQDDWKRSGLSGKPESSLILRKPQVESAKASVRAAKASLEKAKQDIAHTLIRAPFDAVVVKSDIAPGSYVQPSTAIATLYSSDRAEIRLPLSAKQWALLPDEKILESGDWQVTIQSSDGTGKWEGRVIRVERHMDKTRQRTLIAAVSNPFSQNPPLMPGTFVSASIPGAEMSRSPFLPRQ
ncbi:MAG: efflux RND transporter periplasmic adaptor subunit [Desulfobacteraceae bacterium]|nr:efflux RND transporter periplasmic adaptor subunit [Desulfobacteraceae bacterium]